jgi:hypothetical protein
MIVTRPITTNYGNYDRNVSVQSGSGALKLGQVVDAVILTNSTQGNVSLRIGGIVLNASTNVALQQNAHLSLKVVQIHPQLLLQLIPSSTETVAARPLQDATISLLPQQGGIAPVLAELIHKAMISGKYLEQQSRHSLIKALFNSLPIRNTLLHAEGMRQAVLQSGLFLESILSKSRGNSRAGIARDIKAALLRLQHSIGLELTQASPDDRILNLPVSSLQNPMLPPRRKRFPIAQPRVTFSNFADNTDIENDIRSLYSKIQSAIARLSLLQVNTAENFFRGEYMWQLEIAVKHTEAIEIISLTIENEQKDPHHKDKNAWVVNLALDLPQLGPIQVRISLFKQGFSSCFWSESSNTLRLIEGKFEQLRTTLEQQGVKTLALCCQQGKPAVTEPGDTDISNIDLRA